MNSKSFKRLLQDLVNEYGHYQSSSMVIDALHLSLTDKRLVLSHLLESDDYSLACGNPTVTEAFFADKLERIQELLNDTAQDVYESFLEEAGLVYRMRADNGELYVRRR